MTPRLTDDPRGELLRRFDIAAAAFASHCRDRAPGGAAIARSDTNLLWRLASAIAAALGEWTQLTDGLDLARSAPLDSRLTADLVLEVVFDPVLEPGAWRVLAAALALAR